MAKYLEMSAAIIVDLSSLFGKKVEEKREEKETKVGKNEDKVEEKEDK